MKLDQETESAISAALHLCNERHEVEDAHGLLDIIGAIELALTPLAPKTAAVPDGKTRLTERELERMLSEIRGEYQSKGYIE